MAGASLVLEIRCKVTGNIRKKQRRFWRCLVDGEINQLMIYVKWLILRFYRLSRRFWH